MRFNQAVLALAMAAATGSLLRAQEAKIATTTDVPGSASPSTIVYEDAAVPAELPANSPWLDPLNVRFFAETGFNLVRPVQHGPVLVGSRPVANAFGPAGIVTTKFRFPLQVAPRVTLVRGHQRRLWRDGELDGIRGRRHNLVGPQQPGRGGRQLRQRAAAGHPRVCIAQCCRHRRRRRQRRHELHQSRPHAGLGRRLVLRYDLPRLECPYHGRPVTPTCRRAIRRCA